MKIIKERLDSLENQFDQIIQRLYEFEEKFADELSEVNPVYAKSALNLVHYLA